MNEQGRQNPFEVIKYLLDSKFKRGVYFPNAGNLGDGLIALATYQQFEKRKIDLDISGPIPADCSDTLFVFAGGGNYTPEYNRLRALMDKLSSRQATLLVLPHSSYGMTKHINTFKGTLLFFAREHETYQRLGPANTEGDLYHYDDVALSFDLNHREMKYFHHLKKVYGSKLMSPRLFAFRKDGESDNKQKPIDGHENHDLSSLFLGPDLNRYALKDPRLLYQHVAWLFAYILPYDEVITDRLHVTVAALLSGKKVKIYDNSYGKLSSVYRYSLSRLYGDRAELCT